MKRGKKLQPKTNAPARIPLAWLRTDGGTQSRALIDGAIVEEYSDAYEARATMPPLIAYYDGKTYWLADGFHRRAALELTGKKSCVVDVRQGTQRDAILFSLGANATHGLRRTTMDKRRAIEALLRDPIWSEKSDRWISDVCRVSRPFVANYRRQVATLPPGEAPSDRREGLDGKLYPAAREARSEQLGLGEHLEPRGFEPRPERVAAETWIAEKVERYRWKPTAMQREAVAQRYLLGGAPAAFAVLKAIAWSQWFTRPELAARMVEIAELGPESHERVLEPSAGAGAIAKAVRKAAPHASITACEIDPEYVTELRRLGRKGVIDTVIAGDFFSAELTPHDVAIQNTAYEDGADGRFLARAMELADRVVALLRTNALHGAERFDLVWSKCVRGGGWGVHDLVYLAGRPDFESVIDVDDRSGNPKSDFVIVRLDRGYRGKARLDWWRDAA